MPRIVIEDLQPGEVVSVSLSDDCEFEDPNDGEEMDDETEQSPPLKVVGVAQDSYQNALHSG